MKVNTNNAAGRVLAADVLRELGVMNFSPPPLNKTSSIGDGSSRFEAPASESGQVATPARSNPTPDSIMKSLAAVTQSANAPVVSSWPNIQIPDHYCPKSSEEKGERVEFLVHMFLQASNEVIHGLMEAHKIKDQSATTSTAIDSAIKSLATISTYIAGLEQGGAGNPDWFVDIIFLALRRIDQQKPIPAARTIIEKFGSLREDVMRKEFSASISEILGMHEQRDAVAAEVDLFLTKSREYRNELFAFALGQSREVVHEHMVMLSMLAA